jgi:uncharacterized beta-barrel protein YwiB (DUF1934 family)
MLCDNENALFPVTIRSHFDDGYSQDNTEVVQFGKLSYFEKERRFVLEYTEGGNIGNSSNSGCENREKKDSIGFAGCKVTVTADENRVVISRVATDECSRENRVQSELVVEKNRTNYCAYQTPYGTMTVGVTGSFIQAAGGENNCNIGVRYAIDINGGIVARADIRISACNNGVNVWDVM